MDKIIIETNSGKHFGLTNAKVEIGRFPDGEVSVVLKEDVRDREVFIIGSTESPAENLIELTFLIQKSFADGVKKVTAVIPYFGYSRGDREAKEGEVASAQAAARIIQSVAKENFKIVCFDLHSPRIPGFFTHIFQEISIIEELSRKFLDLPELSIVAPDEGASGRAMKFAEILGIKDIVKAEKKRISETKVEITNLTGQIKERAVIVDDMVQTGGTILETAKILREKGAKEIFVAVTHMVYAAGGWKKLAESDLITRIVTTDTISPPERLSPKFEIVSILPVLKSLLS